MQVLNKVTCQGTRVKKNTTGKEYIIIIFPRLLEELYNKCYIFASETFFVSIMCRYIDHATWDSCAGTRNKNIQLCYSANCYSDGMHLYMVIMVLLVFIGQPFNSTSPCIN